MPIQRLFVIAPSVARLIRKERGGEHVREGYFPAQSQRSTYVRVEDTRGSLILEDGADTALEEQAELPPAHAQALLAVSQGQVEYVRTRLSIGSYEIQVLHFVRPGPLDLVVLTNAPDNGQDVPPLPWFGPEVSAEPGYQRRRLALDGAPNAPDIDFSNATLASLLDLLEDRITTWPQPQQPNGPDARASEASPASDAPASALETEADEDAAIRELARSLQPRQC